MRVQIDRAVDTRCNRAGDHFHAIFAAPVLVRATWWTVPGLWWTPRKWLLSKMFPNKHGDKVEAQLSGPDGGPIQEHLSVEYIRQKINRALTIQ